MKRANIVKSENFVGELKRLRYSAYMTQGELCRRSNIPLGTYKAWECGTQFPTPRNWQKYIEFFERIGRSEELEKIIKIYTESKGMLA